MEDTAAFGHAEGKQYGGEDHNVDQPEFPYQ
jgi:hypothetical protein